MSAPFIIPFNFDPISTTLKTSSYTIPSGQYAEIHAQYPNMSINGVDIGIKYILESGSMGTNGQTVTWGTATPFVYQMDWSLSGSGVDYVTVNGGVGQIGRPGGSPPNSGTFTVTNTIGGGSMTLTSNDTFSYTIYTWTMPPHKIWVEAGDVISGSGFLVTLYNKIS
jgi:hypothetical protein